LGTVLTETEIDDLRVEEAILISRLHLLSDHAQNLEVEQNPEISAARKEVPSIEQRSVNVPSQLLRDPSARTNHGWMIEVLSDLIAYSRDHDLPSISKHLEKALKNTHTNWGPEESASTGGEHSLKRRVRVLGRTPKFHSKIRHCWTFAVGQIIDVR